jgi:hypothetical protein
MIADRIVTAGSSYFCPVVAGEGVGKPKERWLDDFEEHEDGKDRHAGSETDEAGRAEEAHDATLPHQAGRARFCKLRP